MYRWPVVPYIDDDNSLVAGQGRSVAADANVPGGRKACL
jgi:hypothetical protein